MSVHPTPERVRITAYFQGEVKHKEYPLSLGRVLFKLPDSETEINLLLPDAGVHREFQPLKFCVRTKENFSERKQEGLRITVDKANNFAMSVYVFEPGRKIGPKVLQPDGTIWQQETVRRSEDEVPVTRPAEIEPGAHYRLEINSEDGCSAQAQLVKIEEPVQESKAMDEDSPFFQTVFPAISGVLQLKVMESKLRASMSPMYGGIIFKSEFNEDLAKRSILAAINKLHSELRGELEEISQIASSTHDIKLGEKALGRFLLALDRNDIGQLLKDQLEAAVGEEQYPILLGLVYNDIYVRFIDLMVDNAKKYASAI